MSNKKKDNKVIVIEIQTGQDDDYLNSGIEVLIPDANIALYWYTIGDYEGTGELLYKDNDDKWYYYSLSHCSCYGPLDDFSRDAGTGFDTLEETVNLNSKDIMAVYIKEHLAELKDLSGEKLCAGSSRP